MELQAFFLTLTTIIGFISFTKTLVTFSMWVWVTFFRQPKNLKDYGSWALITGSTNGIGKALAFELASKGLNLVLFGRDPSNLEYISNEIWKKYDKKIEVKTIVIDFLKDTRDEVMKKVAEKIEGVDVGILINNAGMAYPYARFFHEVDLEMMNSVIRVNVEGATWVTKAVIHGMLKKKKGAIINIGSGSATLLPSYPLHTVYATTKAYLEMFSRSIALEYKQHGIDVQCQIPMLVATKMTSIRRSSFFVPSPEMYSKASLRWIGYESVCVPYWPHSIQGSMIRALPDTLINWCLLRYFLGMRKRGQHKDSTKYQKKNP